MDFLKKIFGEKVSISELIANGAVVVDVRTKDEFQRGHLRNAINIPLDRLPDNLKKLDRNKAIVTCCASGSRSATAKNYLRSKGFEQVYNGGSWISLRS
ncbi:MAG TPA: rhodanese-like domain-containing protein [Bacteroidales bacterium]|nr:rhodanese-like domain-containing protein [Bacteroidales bacterium]